VISYPRFMPSIPRLLLPAAICAASLLPAPAAPVFHEQSLFVSGQNGYHAYRIPAIVRATTATLLAFCEGRRFSQSDTGAIDLLVRRSTDNGDTWSPQKVVWNNAANTCGNPSPVVDHETGTTATVRPNENLAVELVDPAPGGGSRIYFNARDHQGPHSRASTFSNDGGPGGSAAARGDIERGNDENRRGRGEGASRGSGRMVLPIGPQRIILPVEQCRRRSA